jgi:hypothetical protein
MAKAAPLKRLNVGLKRIGGGISKIKRTPLTFVPEQPNPLACLPQQPTMEKQFEREMDAFSVSFRVAAKKEAADTAHAFSEYGAECFVMVFQDAPQATAFLKHIGYPVPKDVFVDGTIVAEILGVPLPASTVEPPKRIKLTQDKKLAKLVTKR